MKITKLGHCCLVIEEAGQKILTDPGTFTTSQNDMTDINILLITHEHADHYHLDSVMSFGFHDNEVLNEFLPQKI